MGAGKKHPTGPPRGERVIYVERPRRRVWPWVLLGCVVLFAGCAALIGSAANKAIDELNAEQARHAITLAQFDAIPFGITRAQLVAQLGKEPEDAQEFVSQGVLDESEVRSSCVYYNRQGATFGDLFQFCFENDSLKSKNSY